jgi:hypothetical protein
MESSAPFEISENSDQRASTSEADGSRLKSKLITLTGMLVAVPAFVNAAYDVYTAIAKLPRTDAEKVNAELFQKYFNKHPLIVMPVPIKHPMGTVDVTFAVYEEGDVYVEYGKQTQWFAFPRPAPIRAAELSLIGSAHAAAVTDKTREQAASSRDSQMASVSGSISGNVLTRSKTYNDGTVEYSKIDIRSGVILDEKTLSKPRGPSAGAGIPTMKIEPIDLERLRR